MSLIELKSPAKINLYLKVLQKKDDGYHNIETCFQYIDLYDHMSFINSEKGISIESNNAFLEGSNNTIYQSAKLLADIGDISSGVNIKIEKNIPIGAGLGGGSSNAASTIVALNKLWGLGLNKNKMLEIAKKIGADVPFFIYGDNAYGKGIGDTLEFKESIRDKILLIDPKINNSSAEMFELFDNFKQSNKNTSNYPQNDFWDVFLEGNKSIREFFTKINKNHDLNLSGSGSCMFVKYNKRENIEGILKKIPSNWRFFFCKPLQYSPLMKFV